MIVGLRRTANNTIATGSRIPVNITIRLCGILLIFGIVAPALVRGSARVLSAGDALCGGGGSTSWLHGKCCYCCGAGYYCSEEEEEALVHFNNVTVLANLRVLGVYRDAFF